MLMLFSFLIGIDDALRRLDDWGLAVSFNNFRLVTVGFVVTMKSFWFKELGELDNEKRMDFSFLFDCF